MITRIELHNFMSHRRTVIEPAAGLTVLIGPNNCGKSAFVAALQILCLNENSTYVKRHGTKECAVVVHTSEGHVVEWRRKNSPRYVINGVEHSRLGNAGVPAELHALLRLPLVADEDDDSFNVHFGSQKSPIFLLNSRPGTAAKFFASSSDAIRLLQMQQRHKERMTEKRRLHKELEAEAAIVSAELETLEATVPLGDRLAELEQQYQLLGRLETEISALLRSESELVDRQNRVDRFSATSAALSPLAPPPVLEDPDPLERRMERLRIASIEGRRLTEDAGCLAALSPPPELEDEQHLERHIAEMTFGASRLDELGRQQTVLKGLATPPAIEDTIALQALIQQLDRVAKVASTSKIRCEQLSALTEPPRWDSTDPLEELARRLEEQQRQVADLTGHLQAVSGVGPCPSLEDDATLSVDLDRLAVAVERVAEMARVMDQLQIDRDETEAALRAAASAETCPTCGQPFDAERLMDLTGGRGGHAHGAA